ncbi:MAG: 1,4-dihydroxy-2-naphthoate octaprenyltransferase [Cardiobacteriaceae bacterium]|nr:1,4-dihydroxy-2-naphthoate octaprenyltransferase [Cardiobacteriaceae bacterium]
MFWIELFRLRTLPLSLCAVLIGNALAHQEGFFEPKRFVFTLLTAVLLQILCNIANDYGDGIRGSDKHRPLNAPKRFAHLPKYRAKVQSALWGFLLASVVSGWILLSLLPHELCLIYLGLGIASLLAALCYTLGKKPYGYHGFGEVSVLLFFGLVGVVGSYGVQGAPLSFWVFLPALGFGLGCVSVLMINNLRDWENDALAGKRTLAVQVGIEAYQKMYRIIMWHSLGFWLLYSYHNPRNLLMLLIVYPTYKQIHQTQSALMQGKVGKELACHVRLLCLSTFLFLLAHTL